MAKRKRVPSEIETELLIRSRRRCCICFGLHQDLDVKKGQIAHLDHNPSNNKFDNLAWLCHDHHDEYDSTTRQSKGLTIQEMKKYSDSLYEAVSEIAEAPWRVETVIPLQDVPLLSVARSIDPKKAIPVQGIQLTDGGVKDDVPWLYLQFYFKRSRYFGQSVPDMGEKWLYVEANMRPALNLRVQVRAWNERDVAEFLRFLHNGGRGYDLHGPRPGNDRLAEYVSIQELHAGDYLYVWQENGERRILISTFTATNAGISVHARLTDDASRKLAKYLESVGFAS